MTRLRVGVLSNPTAALGAAQRIGRHVEHLLRVAGMSVVDLSGPSAPVARARALEIRDTLTALVVVGGDGTVALGAQIVAGTPVRLGIVPAGSGNDFARSLDIPVGAPEQAVRILLRALSRPAHAIDVMRVVTNDGGPRERETVAVGNVSLGFDALVNARANRSRGHARSRYTAAVLRELPRFTAIPFWTEIDGGPRTELDAAILTVCNSGALGGGMRFCPDAQLDDGILDLFAVDAMPRAQLLRLFPRVFRGTHTQLPQVRISPIRSLRVGTRGPSAVLAHADGEGLGPFPLRIEAMPSSVRLLADQRRPEESRP